MAFEISSLDLHYLVREMAVLEGARIDKIIQPAKDEVYLQLYATGRGKALLKIKPPFEFYISSKPAPCAESMQGFCAALRKYIANARLEKITQHDSERIAVLEFKKAESYFLIAELFAGGNLVLCKSDFSIIVPLKRSRIKDRQLGAGHKYEFPAKRVDFLNLKKSDLEILKCPKENISKALAVEFGLGGIYAGEICLAAGITGKETSLSDLQIKKVESAFKKITAEGINAFILKNEERPIPFEMISFKDAEKEHYPSFSDAVEAASSFRHKVLKTGTQKEIEKLQRIIEAQEKTISELEESADENQKKGELIYEKYSLVSEILSELKKAREKYSWKEIREKLKGHKIIKEIDEKTGEAITDL